MEQWRDIPGYEGLYQISIDTKEGKCKSLRTGKLLSNKPDKRDGRILWDLYKNRIGLKRQAARWIAITFPELIENEYFEGAEIDHKDRNRLNNHPSNLRWVTRSENLLNRSVWKIKTKKRRGQNSQGKHSRGRPQNSGGKTVFQFNDRNELLGEFQSAREAERITGVKNNHIILCCLGKQKKAGKKNGEKYIWRYAK